VDDLLNFRQFSKKAADDMIDVRAEVLFYISGRLTPCGSGKYDADVGRATGVGEIQEDFMSNLSRISQLTGTII
jgi:coatomer subunit beta